MSILQRFFKGNSLESEFGFVNYYHSHPTNRLLHTLAIPLLILGMLMVTYSIDYRLALFFDGSYLYIIRFFGLKIMIPYCILFSVLYHLTVIICTQWTKSILYGFGIFLTGLLMQGFGHYKFQQAPPAFRLFEAVFTTPAFLMMYLITDHNKPFWKNVEKETDKWKEILNK